MTDLTGLIEKLEGAEAGSWKLDAAVFEAFGYEVKIFPVGAVTKILAYPPSGPKKCEPRKMLVSRSLDAALALVEERGEDPLYLLQEANLSLQEKTILHDADPTVQMLTLEVLIALCRALQSTARFDGDDEETV